MATFVKFDPYIYGVASPEPPTAMEPPDASDEIQPPLDSPEGLQQQAKLMAKALTHLIDSTTASAQSSAVPSSEPCSYQPGPGRTTVGIGQAPETTRWANPG